MGKCEDCNERCEVYPVYQAGDAPFYLCEACIEEHAQREKEKIEIEEKQEKLKLWFDDRQQLSFEELMIKAYEDFLVFEEIGFIVHLYLSKRGHIGLMTW